MIIEMKQHHFTTSNERKYAYTFYPYKHLLNRAAQFGEVVTDWPCFNKRGDTEILILLAVEL